MVGDAVQVVSTRCSFPVGGVFAQVEAGQRELHGHVQFASEPFIGRKPLQI